MSIKSTHPDYTETLHQVNLARRSYGGSDQIKKAGTEYLKPTMGQIIDGALTDPNSIGAQNYERYKSMAIYPGIYKDAVDAAVGIMHREEPTIQLPSGMEAMKEKCTLLGESLSALLRRINTHQLMSGRLGLLGDLKVNGTQVEPVIIMYEDVSIRNWDDGTEFGDDINVSLVVLDESTYVRNGGLDWEFEERFRLLYLGDPNTESAASNEGEDNVVTGPMYYGTRIYNEEDMDDVDITDLTYPMYLNTKSETIPFVFINAIDLSPTPSTPPLYDLALSCLSIYNSEADYRQHLSNLSQDTLVLVGKSTEGNEGTRIGAGACIEVPIGGDAKFIGITGQGISEQRLALDNDYKRASQKGGQLLDGSSKAKESGEALRIRVAGQTATLPQIAKTGAAGLEMVLKTLATWMGFNPDEVEVKPNIKFTPADLDGTTILNLVQAKAQGGPISDATIHQVLSDMGITKLTYEQEQESIENEAPAPGAGLPGVDG